MAKYIDAELLKKEIKRLKDEYTDIVIDNQRGWVNANFVIDDLEQLQSQINSLQQELDSRSIPVLRADTTEKQDRILEIIGQDKIYCHFSLDSSKETDCGYEDYNDRVYIDGDLTFNKMAEIVDFLSKNSK